MKRHGDAWRLSNKIFLTVRKGKAAFCSVTDAWIVPAASTVKLEEREFVVDSGASLHMVSWQDLKVLCALILDKKNLLKTPCLSSVCFVFFVFHARFFLVSGHLPMLSHIGVACSVVFEQHAVIPVEGSLPHGTNAVGFFCFGNNEPLQPVGAGRIDFKVIKRLQFLTLVELLFLL